MKMDVSSYVWQLRTIDNYGFHLRNKRSSKRGMMCLERRTQRTKAELMVLLPVLLSIQDFVQHRQVVEGIKQGGKCVHKTASRLV